MWRKEAIPQEFKDASIIHVSKRKGNPQICGNHRGITLLSISGKLPGKLLLNRLNVHLDQTGLFSEKKKQCGFRKDRGDNRHDLHSKTASEEMPGPESRLVDFQLGVKLDSISLPDICMESSECHTGSCNSGSDLIINVHCSGKRASQAGEFINNFQFLSIAHCTGFQVLIGVQHLPFCADCEIIVIT